MKASKNFLVKITSGFFLFSLLTGEVCNKPDLVAESKTDMISSGNWYFKAYTETHNGTTTDVLSTMLPCHKDNYYVFRSDGSGEFNYGVQKCSGDPQSIPYTWVFIENETKIKLDNGNVYTINKLTKDELELVLPGITSHTLTLEH